MQTEHILRYWHLSYTDSGDTLLSVNVQGMNYVSARTILRGMFVAICMVLPSGHEIKIKKKHC